MIDNEHVSDRLAFYRDLSPTERREVEAHLAICAQCRAMLAACRRQDAMLKGIADIRPRRDLRPRLTTPTRRAIAYLGDALVLGGLAALLWMFALQVRLASQGVMPGTIENAPAAIVPEPGLTLPPTAVHLPSPWLPALPWVGAALLAVGGLFIFSPRNPAPALLGGALSIALLISFVPPFSALPNPAGVYWRLAGGYRYDPRLPFKNSFLIADQADRTLRPHLDQLVGEVGLSPLDPAQPLARYEILRVGLHPQHNRVALVTTRFIYADGSSRVYPVPLFGPANDISGFWLSAWREDGLQRLRSDHLAFPDQPFAASHSPVRLGPARLLAVNPAANRLDEVNPGHWLWDSVRVQRLVWSPDGRAFLAAMEMDPGQRQLWVVPLDNSPPIPVDSPADIREYDWSSDGRAVVYTVADPYAHQLDPAQPYAIRVAFIRDGQAVGDTLATALPTDKLPGLTRQGVWFIFEDGLWRIPYEGGAPQPMITGLLPQRPNQSAYARPAPDGERLAYACQPSLLCLINADATQPDQQIEVRTAEMAWSPDGKRLAVIDRDPNHRYPVRLVILSRKGETLLTRDIAPHGAVDPPQWTPDGGMIFVQTYPQDGRRIITVNTASGEVLDLSQEHWDAYFALAPDGKSLLLNNGRGGFWLADIIRAP